MIKNARIYLRLSEEEKETLIQKAEESRQSVSAYLLSLAENKKIIVIDGLPELTKQIMKLGTNINQIATIANSQKEVQGYYLKRIQDYQEEILRMLTKLLKAVTAETETDEENNGG